MIAVTGLKFIPISIQAIPETLILQIGVIINAESLLNLTKSDH